jgi:hypothetical protein
VWLNNLRKLMSGSQHRRPGRPRRRATTRPQLEALESRLAPTISITSGNTTAFVLGSSGRFTVQTSGFPAPILSESGALPSQRGDVHG